MSIKIYTAYRMPIGRFSEFVKTYRGHCVRRVVEEIRHVFAIKRGRAVGIDKLRTIMDAGVEASRSPYREECNWDCFLRVFIHGRKIYAICHGEWTIVNGYEPITGVEEYSYWNNTDRPKEISSRMWRARGRTWDRVLDSGQLIHTVIKLSDYVGDGDIKRELLSPRNIARLGL